VSGTLILQGGAPFVGNDDLDRVALAGCAGYVAILPTADAFEGPEKLIETGQVWAQRMGVTVRPVPVYTRADALEDHHAQVLRDAAAVYVVGDSPIHLRSTIMETPVLDALRHQADEGVLVAVAGSAAALCDPMVDPRGGAYALGLGLVRGLALITESESWMKDRLQRSLELANTTVAEVPSGAALTLANGAWTTHGNVIVHGSLPT
jgi:cyanophycinase